MKFVFLPLIGCMALTACATQPDPVPVEEPVAVVEEPVFVTPEPEPAPVIAEALPDLPTPGTFEDFVYQSGGDARVYFGYDQFDLSDGARDVLRRQAAWLSSYQQVTAVIEGNADERGTREYNLALGARRADSVKAFLVSQGVNPSRLTTVSYGKERPIDGGSNEASWSRNRNGHTNLNLGSVG